MANQTGLQFTLELAGADAAELAVIDFTLEEALSQPFRLELRFASRNSSLSPSDILDRPMTLTVWQDGEELRRVNAIVTEFGHGDRGHRRTRYSLVARPALWRLGLRHNSRIFQDVSPLTVLNTLCDERGLTDVAFATMREPQEREYLCQYRETDLAFLERLAAEEGLFYFHEFDDGHRLVFADAPQLLPHLGERTYHSCAGGTPPTRHVRRLERLARLAPASVMLKDYTFKKPAYEQLHEHAADGLGEHAQRDDYEHFDYPGRYKADASGVPFTRIRLEHLRRDALTCVAESDLPELAPGVKFTLTDHDLSELNRDWQVVKVKHHGSQPQALEEDGVTQGDAAGMGQMTRYHNDLALMPADQAWRPTPNPKPRVDGPQVAFVVGPEGEEIYCDEHGRVKVQFPWDRYAEPNETASAWVRVSQGWAGGGYGSMAIPRIGHEVVISHLEGDPDQPLITGRTYHAVNTPPYELPAHKTRTVLRTQSHKAEGFNELRFEDEAGEEQIWLHAQKDLELLTHNDRTETIGRDSHLTVRRDRLSEIHGEEHLTVHRSRHEQILSGQAGQGSQHRTVHGSLRLKTGQAWLSESGRELHVKAGQKAVFEAGDAITLRAGGSFIRLDASGVTIVGPRIKVNAGGSPGVGSGQQAEPPRRPGEATPESSEDVTLKAHQQALLDDEVSEALSAAERLQQQANAHLAQADQLRQALNTDPNGRTLEEAEALHAEVERLIGETRAQKDALRDATREGRLGGDDFIDSHYLVDEAAQRANDLRQEAERQVRYASPSGQTARAVGTFAAEVFTPYGTAVDAQDTYQLWGEGRYGAATGMAALTAVSVVPGVRAVRKVGEAGDGVRSGTRRSDSAGMRPGRLPAPQGALTPDDFPYAGLNHRRAAAGEHNAHLLMQERGFIPVGNTNGRYTPGAQGIDGIYRNPRYPPPPEFVITEAKYNRARMGNTADGRQMSNDWVTDKRLREAGITRKAERDRILKSLERGDGNVEKYLIRSKPDGSMTTRTLDRKGYVSGTTNGF